MGAGKVSSGLGSEPAHSLSLPGILSVEPRGQPGIPGVGSWTPPLAGLLPDHLAEGCGHGKGMGAANFVNSLLLKLRGH